MISKFFGFFFLLCCFGDQHWQPVVWRLMVLLWVKHKRGRDGAQGRDVCRFHYLNCPSATLELCISLFSQLLLHLEGFYSVELYQNQAVCLLLLRTEPLSLIITGNEQFYFSHLFVFIKKFALGISVKCVRNKWQVTNLISFPILIMRVPFGVY